MTQATTWKSTPFTIERDDSKAPGTLIFRLRGPFTARDMFGKLAPTTLDNLLNLESTSSAQPASLNILDLTNVPYMDSAGLGRIVRHYVHCRSKGVRMIAIGASPRVLEIFKMTKVDAIIPMAATIEEAGIP
jgi:anti-anti-sigma factor